MMHRIIIAVLCCFFAFHAAVAGTAFRGLFGHQFGAVIDEGAEHLRKAAGGLLFPFDPPKDYRAFDRYFLITTPKGRKVFQIEAACRCPRGLTLTEEAQHVAFSIATKFNLQLFDRSTPNKCEYILNEKHAAFINAISAGAANYQYRGPSTRYVSVSVDAARGQVLILAKDRSLAKVALKESGKLLDADADAL